MKIYGRNGVEEALKSDITIEKIYLQIDMKESLAYKTLSYAKEKGIAVLRVPKKALDKQVEENVRHQGFIAYTTDYKYYELEEVLDYASSKGEDPFILVLDGLEDPHNLGSIMRVAEASGVHGIVLSKHRSVSVNETAVKVSAGAASHVKVVKVTNINDSITKLKESGVWVYATDADGTDLYKSNLTGGCAIVIGSEGSGIKRLTKELCDGVIAIPMFGKINSLNASVSAGIVVYERVRQVIAKK